MELIEGCGGGRRCPVRKIPGGEELSAKRLCAVLRNVIRSGQFYPGLRAAGSAEIGIAPLLDAVVSLDAVPQRNPSRCGKGEK